MNPHLRSLLRARRIFVGQILDDGVRRLASFATRVTESTRAVLPLHIENHVVIRTGSRSDTIRHSVEIELMTYLPRHNMIRARGVAADTETTNNVPACVVER